MTGAEKVVMVAVVVVLSLAIGIAADGSGIVVYTGNMELSGSWRDCVFHPEDNHRSAYCSHEESITEFVDNLTEAE